MYSAATKTTTFDVGDIACEPIAHPEAKQLSRSKIHLSTVGVHIQRHVDGPVLQERETRKFSGGPACVQPGLCLVKAYI